MAMSSTSSDVLSRNPRIRPARVTGGKIATLAGVVGLAVAAGLGGFIPKEESGRTVDASIAEDGTLVVKHISGRQYLNVYLDMVGVPTACDGITTVDGRAMRPGESFSEAECARLLEIEMIKHAEEVMQCTPGLALSDDPDSEHRREGPRFAAVSLAYNIGGARYCRSTARKRFNAGNYAGGCTALTWWNRAGGRVVRGLVNRRAREAKVCREGLAALGDL